MAIRGPHITTAQWLGRTAVIWLIELVTVVIVAAALGGVQLAGLWPAVQFTAFVGILNALLWPVLARLTLPFLVFSFGFFTFLLNGLIFWIGGQFVPGIHFNNYGYALIAAIVVTVANTTISGLLTIDEDASFYRSVLQRATRRMANRRSPRPYPGILFLELDGLSEPVLRHAIATGHMPALADMLESGSHELIAWETDLSSQTGAAQAGILHGNNFNIPAFRWVEKGDNSRVISSFGLRDAEAIEERISDGNGLLRRNGCSRANLFTGDAADVMLTYSRATSVAKLYTPSYFAFFANSYNFVRTLSLMVVDMVREVRERWHQERHDIRPRLSERRRGLYPLLRSATAVLLRDVTIDTLITDVLQGDADVIYATLSAYDEVAHHSGIADRDSLRVLSQLDRAFSRVKRAAQTADRPYQFVILSDHGQTQGSTFKQRYGVTLKQAIQALLPRGLKIHARLQTDEEWGHVAALVSEVAQQEPHMLSRLVRTVTRQRTEEGEVAVGPDYQRILDEQAGRVITAEEAQLIVLASGNLGLVYFTDWQERLTLEVLEAHFPGLVDGLVRHPGVGFVLVRSERYGPLAIGPRGIYYLAQDRVTGDNPLAYFSLHAPMLLRRADLYDNAPDLLINSFYDPVTDEACAFEELIGFHGGLGGGQNRPFLLAPAAWRLRYESIVGAEQLYRVLKRHVDAMPG